MEPPQVESYRFGRIVIDGQVYAGDLLLLPSGVLPGWHRGRGHALGPGDLAAVRDAKPNLLIVGSGAYGRMQVTRQVHDFCAKQGITLLVLETGAACREYNLQRANQHTAAALHLTC